MLSEKPWTLDAVIRLAGGIFAGLVFGMLLDSALTPWLRGWTKADVQLVHFVIGALTFQGAILLFINLFLHEFQLSWTEAFGLTTPSIGKALALAVALSVVVLIVALGLGWLSAEVMLSLGIRPESQTAVQIMQTTHSLPRQIFYGAVAIILAPAAEELLFRGILYPTVKQYGHPRLALWGTSVLFAVIHFNLMSLLPLVFVAVMLTLLYERTNNLLAPMVTHSLFNTANFILLLNEREITQWLHWYYERV